MAYLLTGICGLALIVWGQQLLHHYLQARLEQVKLERMKEQNLDAVVLNQRSLQLSYEHMQRANAETERHRRALREIEEPWRGDSH